MKKNILLIMCFILMCMIFTGCDKNQEKEQLLNNSSCNKNTKAFLNYDFGNSYKNAIKDDKPMLLVFYVNWCAYCRRLMPKLAGLNNEYKDKYNIVLIDCEDKKNVSLVKKYNIQYYPMIYLIKNKGKYEEVVPSQYTISSEAFKQYLDKNLQ